MNIENVDKNGFVNYFDVDYSNNIVRIGSHDGKTGHSDNCIGINFDQISDYVNKNKLEIIKDFGEDKFNEIIKTINDIFFQTKAEKKYLSKNYWFLIVFGCFWTFVSLGVTYLFLYPLFKFGKIEMEINNELVVGTWNNLQPVYIFLLFLSIFYIIGIIPLILGIIKMNKKGPLITITQNSLNLKFKKYEEIYTWNNFTNQLYVKHFNNGKSNFILFLKTGRMINSKYSSTYVHDEITLGNVISGKKLETILKQKILTA